MNMLDNDIFAWLIFMGSNLYQKTFYNGIDLEIDFGASFLFPRNISALETLFVSNIRKSSCVIIGISRDSLILVVSGNRIRPTTRCLPGKMKTDVVY